MTDWKSVFDDERDKEDDETAWDDADDDLPF